ncbi:hypothetical protein HAHE_34050 [Haloferula helveola]|uniref:Uncharacterized protein n=1 Tax=Haloferula helveola TaxID=490095 RepID=A0ABN6H740_9BACT|nr:hypothetical protein HAHE_34050 [Haloferula helveola]
MKSPIKIITAFAFGLGSVALSMPATKLISGEWCLPTEAQGLVVIDEATGQLRFAQSDPGGRLTWSPVVRTYLSDVSDVAGSLDGNSGELLALTNPWANRIVTVEIDDPALTLGSMTPPHVGPAAICEIDTSGPELLIGSNLAGGGAGAWLDAVEDIPAGGVPLAQSSGFAPIDQLEPLFETLGGDRMAVGRIVSTSTKLFLSYRGGGAVSFAIQDTIAGDWQIASSVIGEDGRTMVVAWQTGGTTVLLYTLNGGIGAGSALTLTGEPKLILSGGIGSIQRVEVPGAPDGFLAVSRDGSEAVWVRVFTGKTLSVEAGFQPTAAGLQINALVPVDGVGLVQLDGKAGGGPSSAFESHVWTGTRWGVADAGSLPKPLSNQTDFATIFYFDSEPFLTETASLLGLEIQPDWTTGSTSSPFPPSITGETYGSTTLGLGSPGARGFTAPGGSGYLLSNQHEPYLSISALRSNDLISTPSLIINPPGGSSPTTVEVSALFDAERYVLKYRKSDPGSPWQDWSGGLSVPYSSTWYFYLEDQITGDSGPITSRTWTIPVGGLNGTDSDSDGVPDYVEAERGLDPFGGADSDGDGASDLEEILAGTDPTDDSSIPSPRNPIPQGEGVRWLATAGNHTPTARISNGEAIEAHDMAGALLARDEVESLTHPTLGSIRAAEPVSNSSPAQTEWAALASPIFFDVGTGVNPPRTGREMIRLVGIPSPSGPVIGFTPSGANSSADAAGWIAAAQAAYSTWSPVSELTEIFPEHSAMAILCEAMIYDRLVAEGLLGAPVPTLPEFGIFPWRSQDAGRLPLDRPMISGLASLGYDFSALRDLVEAEVETVSTTRDALRSAADAIYAFHIANSDSSPGLESPFRVLRDWIEGLGFPASYSGVVTDPILTDAETAIAEIRGLSGQPYRPVESWAVEVAAQGVEPPGVAIRQPGATPVALLRPTGEPFLFEQGIGVVEGTTLTVQGFVDVTSPTGYPAMEVTALVYNSLPKESARDQDANLLDDEWERFFFGSTGNDPYSVPAASNFTLLEHYLAGTDPRGGDDPPSSPADLSPPALSIEAAGGGVFEIEFAWPEEYFEQMDFIVEGSPDLSPGSFVEIPGAVITPLGGGLYLITLPPVPPAQVAHFYRVRLALPEN